jgi:phospholipase/carboxylesterase
MAQFEESLALAGSATLAALATVERVQRRLHPPAIPALRTEVSGVGDELARSLPVLRDSQAPTGLEPVKRALLRGAELTLEACTRFTEQAAPREWVVAILRSMHSFARAQEALYPLRGIPPIGRYFAEPAAHARLEALEGQTREDVSVGLHSSGSGEDAGERGGFCLYVPERYEPDAAWPLVVALHGGSGSGREFLWAWLREARTRGFLVLAPTARGPTWSMLGPDVDGASIEAMVDYVKAHWSIDPERILLTGLSDGATYGLHLALREGSPFSAVAPIAGTLHPRFMTETGARGAARRRVYLVHGVLDWMFPVEQARFAAEQLRRVGADVVYREIEDLSHTYPREENDSILAWFDARLRLPIACDLG